jgi:hypothetical protein
VNDEALLSPSAGFVRVVSRGAKKTQLERHVPPLMSIRPLALCAAALQNLTSLPKTCHASPSEWSKIQLSQLMEYQHDETHARQSA